MNFRDDSMRWLYLGIAALALSGLYSVALVLLRTPILVSILDKEIFRTTLVIHVNLSVLVWLTSSIAALWVRDLNQKYDYWANYCNYLGLLGVVMMAISPMVSDSDPVLNNYIPMLENWCFILGLTLFGCALIILALLCMPGSDWPTRSSIIIFLMACICLILSYRDLGNLEYPLDIHFYYEALFWSGGHILQFVYAQGVMIVWSLMLRSTKFLAPLSVLNLILVLPALYVHVAYRVDSAEFIEFFTLHMKYCGGIAPSLLLVGFIKDYKCFRDVQSSTSTSLFLFFFGGLLGCLIHDVNVTIPAHYHGSIVGISIAFMGLCYSAFKIENKWSRWQPRVYALGQTMHIVGLAWSGGYGVLRKTPAAELSAAAKISMGFMGLGGLIAIIGGLMFVCICYANRQSATSPVSSS